MLKKDHFFNFVLSKKCKDQLQRVAHELSLKDGKNYSCADIIRISLESKFGIKNE